MIDKTGKAYENLAQVIFQSVIDQKQFPNLKVDRNVTLQGKTTSHQIDVYWKFEVGGVPHEVIVQAKDWATPVKKGQLLQFKGVLDDLPGQPRGVFVTRSGYQKGAKDYALAHGIVLYELMESEPSPPVGITAGGWAKVSLIYMPLHGAVKAHGEDFNTKNLFAWGVTRDICTPHFSEINFGVSKSWLEQEYHSQDLSNVKRLENLSTPLTDMTLHNQEGTAISNLQTLFSEFAAAMKEEGVDQKQMSHIFPVPTFIRVASAAIPYFKIDTVSVTVTIEHSHQTQRLKMSNFSQLVLHELNRDRTQFFAMTPSVTADLSSKDKV